VREADDRLFRTIIPEMSPERSQHRISFEEIISNAKEVTLRDGYHVPIVVMDGSKGLSVAQFQEISETHGGRMEVMRFLGQAAARDGRVGQLRQVFLISEAWMSRADKGNPPTLRPSQDPNRKEVLIVSALQIEGRSKQLKLFEMRRNEQQRVIGLTEIEPDSKKGTSIEIPLLEAFVQGYQIAYQQRAN